MSISRDDIQYTAGLAKLDVPEGQIENLTAEMSNVLHYFEKLQEVSTDGVEPTSLLEADWGEMGDDKPAVPLPREKALENAPDTSEGHFVVPRVL